MRDGIEDIFALPIDQYSRQQWAFYIIDSLRGKRKKLKILDVGGYKGKTALFQKNDVVTVCDLFDVDEPGYVKGDGKVLPFKDDEFDFVVTFDTYEHVPRDGRQDFIKELVRVTKEGVILAAPFDNSSGSVTKAEEDLNEFHKLLYEEDHKWLREHIDYQIPKKSEIDKLLLDLNMNSTNIPSNDLAVWELMQTLYFSINIDDDLRGRVDDVNRMYNSNVKNIDITDSDSAYRQIYFFSPSKINVDKVAKTLIIPDTAERLALKASFVAFALKTYGLKYRDIQNYRKYLEKEIKELIPLISLVQEKDRKLASRIEEKFRRALKQISYFNKKSK